MADLKVVKSEPLPPAPLSVVKSEPLMSIESVGEWMNKPIAWQDQLKTLGSIVASPITSLANAPMEVWDWIKRGGHNPMSGGHLTEEPITQMYGNAAMALAPTATEAMKAGAPGIKGAVKGAAKASVEPVSRGGHFKVPLPAPLAAAGAGAFAAHQIGIPGELGAAIGFATPIVRGAVTGFKEGMAKGAAAAPVAEAAAAPAGPDPALLQGISRTLSGKDFSKLTPEEQANVHTIAARLDTPPAEAAAPAAAPPVAPVEQPAAPPAAPALPRTLSDQVDEFLASQRQATEPIPAPAPAPPEQGAPPGIVEPPPTGGRIERAPLPPRIQTPPQESPGQAALRTASEKAQQRTAASKAKLRAPVPEPEPVVTPGRDVMLAGDQPAVGRSQQATQAAGDLADALRPPRTEAEAIAYNRPLKAARYAEALQKGGIKATDVGEIENGYVSAEQIQQGAAPRWGNIAESLGEDVPSPATIKLIKTELNRRKLRPKQAPAAPEVAPAAGAAEAAPTVLKAHPAIVKRAAKELDRMNQANFRRTSFPENLGQDVAEMVNAGKWELGPADSQAAFERITKAMGKPMEDIKTYPGLRDAQYEAFKASLDKHLHKAPESAPAASPVKQETTAAKHSRKLRPK